MSVNKNNIQDFINIINFLTTSFGESITLRELNKKLFIQQLKLNNKYFECKNCSGKGYFSSPDGFTEQKCSEEEAIENASFYGSFAPQYYMQKVPKIKTTTCKYCNGNGYTEKELKPITKEIIVGYE